MNDWNNKITSIPIDPVELSKAEIVALIRKLHPNHQMDIVVELICDWSKVALIELSDTIEEWNAG